MIKAEIIDKGPLTDSEIKIAMLIVEAKPDKAIAQILSISIKTVNSHIANIYLKLQACYGSASANTAALNMRCWAVSTLIARQLIKVSVKALALMLMINASLVDDEMLRLRSGRVRVHVSESRLRRDA